MLLGMYSQSILCYRLLGQITFEKGQNTRAQGRRYAP